MALAGRIACCSSDHAGQFRGPFFITNRLRHRIDYLVGKSPRRLAGKQRVRGLCQRINIGCWREAFGTEAARGQRTVLRRSVNIGSNTRDRRIRDRKPRHAKIRDLRSRMICREQNILRLDVAMDNSLTVSVAESGTNLLDIAQRPLYRQRFAAHHHLQIAAGEVFEDEIVKDGSLQIASSSMAQAADDIRMSHSIDRDRFVLKILDQSPFKVCVEIVL